jgi:hypothetical protein
MGQNQSKNNSETINWNKIKTDNISSSVPNFNGLSNDAKNLIASLNIPEITESQTSEITVNNILDKISNNLGKDDLQKFNQLLDQVSSQTAEDSELSATSPFISSEMYNYLISNNNEEIQKGGSRKLKNKKGGYNLDDDSSTSSTSSDSSMEDLLDSSEREVKKYAENKKNKKNKLNKRKDSDSELSGGELSYLSSSAHTDGEYSDSHNSKQSSSESATTHNSHQSTSENESSDKQSTVSDHNQMQSTSISVNTEDINMVSDY